MSIEYDESKTIDSQQIVKLTAMRAKVALIARSVLGADELSDESMLIFSSKKSFDRLINIEISSFEDMAKENKT